MGRHEEHLAAAELPSHGALGPVAQRLSRVELAAVLIAGDRPQALVELRIGGIAGFVDQGLARIDLVAGAEAQGGEDEEKGAHGAL